MDERIDPIKGLKEIGEGIDESNPFKVVSGYAKTVPFAVLLYKSAPWIGSAVNVIAKSFVGKYATIGVKSAIGTMSYNVSNAIAKASAWYLKPALATAKATPKVAGTAAKVFSKAGWLGKGIMIGAAIYANDKIVDYVLGEPQSGLSTIVTGTNRTKGYSWGELSTGEKVFHSLFPTVWATNAVVHNISRKNNK